MINFINFEGLHRKKLTKSGSSFVQIFPSCEYDTLKAIKPAGSNESEKIRSQAKEIIFPSTSRDRKGENMTFL